MRSIEFLVPSSDQGPYLNFLVFEPASQRIDPQDILIRGTEVKDIFYRCLEQVNPHGDLKEQTRYNHLSRLQMMIDLVKNDDGLIMTKFLNKVWRRHSFFNHLGELFLEIDPFCAYLSEYNKEDKSLFLSRISAEKEPTDEDLNSEEDSSDESDSDDKTDNATV